MKLHLTKSLFLPAFAALVVSNGCSYPYEEGEHAHGGEHTNPDHNPGHDPGHNPGHDPGHNPGHDPGHNPTTVSGVLTLVEEADQSVVTDTGEVSLAATQMKEVADRVQADLDQIHASESVPAMEQFITDSVEELEKAEHIKMLSDRILEKLREMTTLSVDAGGLLMTEGAPAKPHAEEIHAKLVEAVGKSEAARMVLNNDVKPALDLLIAELTEVEETASHVDATHLLPPLDAALEEAQTDRSEINRISTLIGEHDATLTANADELHQKILAIP